MASITNQGDCAVCGDSTSKKCGGCAEGLDVDGNSLPQPHFLCSDKCKLVDRPSHKDECNASKARKQLYRGGHLLQQMFYGFREVGFDLELVDVQVLGERIHTFDAEFDSSSGPLYPFPDALVANGDVKKALLMVGACNDTLAYMFELTKKVLSGESTQCRPLRNLPDSDSIYQVLSAQKRHQTRRHSRSSMGTRSSFVTTERMTCAAPTGMMSSQLLLRAARNTCSTSLALK